MTRRQREILDRIRRLEFSIEQKRAAVAALVEEFNAINDGPSVPA